jgi:hypothetical protein
MPPGLFAAIGSTPGTWIMSLLAPTAWCIAQTLVQLLIARFAHKVWKTMRSGSNASTAPCEPARRDSGMVWAPMLAPTSTMTAPGFRSWANTFCSCHEYSPYLAIERPTYRSFLL